MSKKYLFILSLCCSPLLVNASSTYHGDILDRSVNQHRIKQMVTNVIKGTEYISQLSAYKSLLEQDNEALNAYLALPAEYKDDGNLAKLLDVSEVLAVLSSHLTPQCISFLASLGWEAAMDIKVEGLYGGVYGFEKNPDAARSYIDRQMLSMPFWAVNKRIAGWQQGIYGFQQNDTALQQEIECALRQGYGASISHLARYLSLGSHGFEMDLAQAKRQVDLGLEAGEKWALEFAIRGLKHGEFGFDRAPKLIQPFLQQQVKKFGKTAEILQFQELKADYFGAKPDVKMARLELALVCLDAALGAQKAWAYHQLGIELLQPTFIEELDLNAPPLYEKNLADVEGKPHLNALFKRIPSEQRFGFICLLTAARMGFVSSWSDLFEIFPKDRELLLHLIAEDYKLPMNMLFVRQKANFDGL